MLQRLIHSARMNVFESARFYYWVLVVLTSYFLLNRFLQKLSYVYLDEHWSMLKTGEGFLFVVTYGFLLISAWYLRREMPSYVLGCWGGVVLIFLINEFCFAWGNTDYSLIESLAKGQGYYTAKFTFPLLFWGVWSGLKNANLYGTLLIHKLQVFLAVNTFFIIAGAVFGISLFQSYPLTGRWGYSGLLFHLSFHCVSYGVMLIYLIEKDKKLWLRIFLFGVALVLLGQKAGLLYLLLIFVIVVIKNQYFRLCLFGSGVGAVFTAPSWLPYVVSFLPFWENVYNKHGVWGVVFSLRNENIGMIWSKINLNFFDALLGGAVRYTTRVEMMPLDIILFYGVIGLFLIGFFYLKIIPSWAWSVPLMVACFAGGVYETPLGALLFFVTLALVKRANTAKVCSHNQNFSL